MVLRVQGLGCWGIRWLGWNYGRENDGPFMLVKGFEG